MGLAVRNHLPVKIGHLLHQIVVLQQNRAIGPYGEGELVAGYRDPGIVR